MASDLIARSDEDRVAEYFSVIKMDEQLLEDCFEQYAIEGRTIFEISFEAGVVFTYPDLSPSLPGFPEGIEYFCFPDGMRLSPKMLDARTHSFIHTSEDGSRLIGCTLVFYEPVDDILKNKIMDLSNKRGLNVEGELFLPIAISFLSKLPFITSLKRVLYGLYTLLDRAQSIPIERYICNFIDDVPAPPAGKVDIHYYIEDLPVTFRCPPINEPNGWTGFPLSPLFSCLSPEHVLAIVSLLLVERQILFISATYDLLTLCAEGITSLIYPFRWVHAYIPILPSRLMGALGAPFPFIFGIHFSTYQDNKSMISSDTVKVFLDQDMIDFGTLGRAPPLPEKRQKKLLSSLKVSVPSLLQSCHQIATVGTIASLAFLPSEKQEVESQTQEASVRSAFLKLFVALFKDYRRFLIYPPYISHGESMFPSSEELSDNVSVAGRPSQHLEHDLNLPRFRFEEFVTSQSTESRALLQGMMTTQLFSQFIDERTMMTRLDKDVIFFDESIDAKLNRYSFRIHAIDTPFLLHNSQKAVKTYVAPSPSLDGLPANSRFCYDRFPSLNRDLFIAPRNVTVRFPQRSDQLINLLCRVRLKRKIAAPATAQLSSGQRRIDGRDRFMADASVGYFGHLSGMSCLYSSFIVCLCRFISSSIESISVASHRPSLISTKHLIDEYDQDPLSSSRARGNSILFNSSFFNSSSSNAKATFPPGKIIASAHLAFKVVLEALNCLLRCNYTPDEVVYRLVAEACADLKLAGSLIDLIVLMDDEGFLPDHHIRHALVRSLTPAPLIPISFPPDLGHEHMKINERIKKCFGIEPAEVWSFERWSSLRRRKEVATIVSRLDLFSSTPATRHPHKPQSLPFNSTEGKPPSSRPQPRTFFPSHSSPATEAGLSEQKEFWSENVLEGLIPSLQWSSIGSSFHPTGERRSFAATKRLHRLVQHSEDLLTRVIPELVIELSPSFGGRQCPGTSCPLQRPLLLSEILKGWEFYQGDANKYTTRCMHCGREFIPRFFVQSTLPSAANSSDQQGPVIQWFEWLSPWVLYKEILNLVLEDGIHAVLINELSQVSGKTPHKSVVFWNLIVFFRLRGLPFSFLLSKGFLPVAFPIPSPPLDLNRAANLDLEAREELKEESDLSRTPAISSLLEAFQTVSDSKDPPFRDILLMFEEEN